jgi:hypothetical protein
VQLRRGVAENDQGVDVVWLPAQHNGNAGGSLRKSVKSQGARRRSQLQRKVPRHQVRCLDRLYGPFVPVL